VAASGAGWRASAGFPLYLPPPGPGGWWRAAGVGSLLLVHVVVGTRPWSVIQHNGRALLEALGAQREPDRA